MIIVNSGRNNLKKQIVKLASKSDQIEIATAFFTESDLIKAWYEKNIEIKLLVSLRPPTSYISLKNLQSSINIEISFLGREFHSKFIIFYKNNKFLGAIIGSSNFTSGGLFKNTETNIFTENEDVLIELKSHFNDLIQNSNLLQPSDLDIYKAVYENWKKRQPKETAELERFNKKITENRTKRNKKSRITKEARQYFEFWRIVDEVRELIRDIAIKEYPNVPVYLTLDHFWHYIKVFWHKETGLKLTKRNQIQMIPKLFKKYIKFHKEIEKGNYPKEMTGCSKNIFKAYLIKQNINQLTELQAKEIFQNLHSTHMSIQRFNADDKFIELNGMPKIRKSLEYLITSNDEIDLRIHNLMKNPKYKLEMLGSSGIQEINGWTRPNKYPIRNKKADDAIKILGYELN